MKSRIYILLAVGILMLSAVDLHAQVKSGSFSISPMAGYSWFAKMNYFEDTETYGAAIGYNFSERFGLEATYNILDTEIKPGGIVTGGGAPAGPPPPPGAPPPTASEPVEHTPGGANVDAYQYALEAIFYIYPGKKFAPYGVVGIGTTEFEYEYDGSLETFSETNIPVGFGFKYFITETIAIRGDFRSNVPMDDNNLRATLGVTFQLGGN